MQRLKEAKEAGPPIREITELEIMARGDIDSYNEQRRDFVSKAALLVDNIVGYRNSLDEDSPLYRQTSGLESDARRLLDSLMGFAIKA